ncbi:hypothetical protein C7404_11988 [Paraburkholderia caballeronis]|nr:hypothetical protein C7406_12388 [Paraburkholderia caballeronis]TDV22410.1 hypothetical protein C7404_11988 [Paraburkholderia caballeronis]
MAAFGLFVLGAIIGAYWTPLGCFLRTHGVGDFVQKVAPGVGVIVAICVFTWQANRARYTMRIDLILKLEERFDSPQMRKTRADAARALQESEDTDADAVGELLDFLEQIGFLVSRHAIDLEAVYEYFDGWIVPCIRKLRRVVCVGVLTTTRLICIRNLKTFFRRSSSANGGQPTEPRTGRLNKSMSFSKAKPRYRPNDFGRWGAAKGGYVAGFDFRWNAGRTVIFWWVGWWVATHTDQKTLVTPG